MSYKRISAGILAGIVVMLSGFFLLTAESGPAQAAVANWQKGVSIDPRSPQDFGSETFRQSLRNAVDMGANSVSLIIPYYQTTVTSHDMGPGWNTPTDAALVSAIDYAHSLRLRVDLKPHLQVSSDNTIWRANIIALDRNAWFKAYENMLYRYAKIAQQHGVENITIGTELINMASNYVNKDNSIRWTKMISDLRSQYKGTLSYSANWGPAAWNDEKNNIKFWDKLDFIGISAYLPLSINNSYTPNSLKKTWDTWNISDIKPLYNTYRKPIIFTEIGYRSSDGALRRPAEWQAASAPDLQEQMDGYQSLFEYWGQVGYVSGINIWDWSSDPKAGGEKDTGFTPQHKPVQDLIKKWFTDGQGRSPMHAPLAWVH